VSPYWNYDRETGEVRVIGTGLDGEPVNELMGRIATGLTPAEFIKELNKKLVTPAEKLRQSYIRLVMKDPANNHP
jgi:hypothetical protein